MANSEDYTQLKKLEESLWRSETRFNPEYMDQIMSPDFFEFGLSGNVYQREEMLETSSEEIGAKIPLENFKVQLLTSNVALVTYMSEVFRDGIKERANRSSIWLKTTEKWQIQFHQGTPTH